MTPDWPRLAHVGQCVDARAPDAGSRAGLQSPALYCVAASGAFLAQLRRVATADARATPSLEDRFAGAAPAVETGMAVFAGEMLQLAVRANRLMQP